MEGNSVEVELQFTLDDYVRASTRLLFTKISFVLLLALTVGAVIYAIYIVISTAGTLGLGPALLAQVPFLLFALIPVVLWFSLRRQGARIIARRAANDEHIYYSFFDSKFVQRIVTDEGEQVHEGGWDTFSQVIETPDDFLLILPRQGGVFIPKRNFHSREDIARFRSILRNNLGNKAKLREA